MRAGSNERRARKKVPPPPPPPPPLMTTTTTVKRTEGAVCVEILVSAVGALRRDLIRLMFTNSPPRLSFRNLHPSFSLSLSLLSLSFFVFLSLQLSSNLNTIAEAPFPRFFLTLPFFECGIQPAEFGCEYNGAKLGSRKSDIVQSLFKRR